MSLNENHRRRIYLTFKYLDQYLSNAAARLGGSEVYPMFPDHRPDATPAQRRAVIDCLQRLRAVMAGFLQARAIPIKEPGTGAVQAFHSTMRAIL